MLLWLTEHYPPSRGGMAQSCDRIVHGLRREGIEVDLVHLTRPGRQLRHEVQLGGHLLTFPLDDDPAHGLNLLWTRLERWRPERNWSQLVAFGGVLPLLAAPTFARWLDLPLVTLFRGNDFDTGIFSLRRSDVVLRAITCSRAVVAVSRDKQRRIERLAPGLRVDWITNGIDLTSWKPLPSDEVWSRAWRESLPRGRRVIGIFGQIKRKKGVMDLLDAMIAAELQEQVHLLVVGDLDEEMTAWLEPRREILSMTHLPFTDRYDLIRYYRACDLVAIPSYYDGTPNVLLESAALGVPTIAARAGGMADHLVDGEQSFLFEPGEPADCRRALMRALDATDDDLARMGEAAAALARRSFDAADERRAYANLFRFIEEARSSPLIADSR